MNGHGRMNFVMKNVPFIQLEDLPRVTAIVNGELHNSFFSVFRLQLLNYFSSELKRSGCVPELSKIPVAKKKKEPTKKKRRAVESNFS